MAQNLLDSPPASSGPGSSHNSGNNNAASSPSKQSPTQQRISVLRLKRQELEKRLQEKNSLLQELCRKEAQLIGVYPTVTVAGQEGHHPSSSADDIGGLLQVSGSSKSHSTHSLPRKIGTGFTLSEKYLRAPSAGSPLNAPTHRDEEELNNLLLQRDIQQQICKASLKLLNDSGLTKSVRRKHKQSYEAAQQKLSDIGKGLTAIQRKSVQQHEYQQHPEVVPGTSQTLPLSVKTNFKVPQQQQQQQFQGDSPVLEQRHGQRRNRHDSYSNPHHSPASLGFPAGTHAAAETSRDHKGLYRSSSNSSSLNNANVLGKSSLSLDNPGLQHQQQQQQHLHQQQFQQPQSQGQGKPMSYESKSLHNFVMSPNHSASSPHHHPALLSPTFYQHHHHPHLQGYGLMTTTTTGTMSGTGTNRSAGGHYPGNSSGLRQSHQQQQFMSPPPQQVVIPQSGLGGYWTTNEKNERVWCASSSPFSPDGGQGSQQQQQHHPATQRFATLDRKPAIYVPSHGKLKMPSPEASPTSGGVQQQQLLNQQTLHQSHHHGYAVQDVGGGGGLNSGKSFSIPNKSTSLGNIEFLQMTTGRNGGGGGGAEDTTSLGSFNSDTNNNPSVYHNLVSAMAGTKVSHYPADEDTENNNNNSNNGPPPPLRPKSSASQHAPEKSWYETSLDKVVTASTAATGGRNGAGAGGAGKVATKGAHKPPALLPRELNLVQAPQLHIDIPTSPIHAAQQQKQQQHHLHQLERSMSHRITGTNFATSSAASPPLQAPPIMRQQQQQQREQNYHQQDGDLHSPMSPQKKSFSSGQRRNTQSNVPISPSAALLSPRLANGGSVVNEEIQVESPKNMTVVQQAKFQPYKEETKPFEMSDFYKYSTKFRQQQGKGSGGGGGGGNALYQQEQQQQQLQRGYSELADVANNNNRGISNNHHNNTNAPHILPKNGGTGTMYG